MLRRTFFLWQLFIVYGISLFICFFLFFASSHKNSYLARACRHWIHGNFFHWIIKEVKILRQFNHTQSKKRKTHPNNKIKWIYRVYAKEFWWKSIDNTRVIQFNLSGQPYKYVISYSMKDESKNITHTHIHASAVRVTIFIYLSFQSNVIKKY